MHNKKNKKKQVTWSNPIESYEPSNIKSDLELDYDIQESEDESRYSDQSDISIESSPDEQTEDTPNRIQLFHYSNTNTFHQRNKELQEHNPTTTSNARKDISEKKSNLPNHNSSKKTKINDYTTISCDKLKKILNLYNSCTRNKGINYLLNRDGSAFITGLKKLSTLKTEISYSDIQETIEQYGEPKGKGALVVYTALKQAFILKQTKGEPSHQLHKNFSKS